MNKGLGLFGAKRMVFLRFRKGAWFHGKRFSTPGFTLAEILIVAALIATLSLTIFQAFSNGVKIWGHGQRFIFEEDLAVTLDRLAQDLRNSMNYSLLAFEGKEGRMSFATIVHAPQDKKISPALTYVKQLGRVEYYFEPSSSTLFRQQANYGQALSKKFAKPRAMASSLISCKFSYLIREDQETKVKPEWEGELPLAVKVDIEFPQVSGNNRVISQVINIPVSYKKNEKHGE